MKPKRRRHWYRRYVGECCICGRDQSYRERVYGPKPKSLAARIVVMSQTETYCGCGR